MAVFCDQKSVLPLGAGLAVEGARCPMVMGIDVAFAHAGVYHWFDGESHAGDERDLDLVVMVGDLGRFMEMNACPMADELVDD